METSFQNAVAKTANVIQIIGGAKAWFDCDSLTLEQVQFMYNRNYTEMYGAITIEEIDFIIRTAWFLVHVKTDDNGKILSVQRAYNQTTNVGLVWK